MRIFKNILNNINYASFPKTLTKFTKFWRKLSTSWHDPKIFQFLGNWAYVTYSHRMEWQVHEQVCLLMSSKAFSVLIITNLVQLHCTFSFFSEQEVTKHNVLAYWRKALPYTGAFHKAKCLPSRSLPVLCGCMIFFNNWKFLFFKSFQNQQTLSSGFLRKK